MEQKLIRKVLQIEGMTCTSCEMRVENALKKLDGVTDVKAIFTSSNVYITYDVNVMGLDRIIEAIEKLDYKVRNNSGEQIAQKQSKENVSDGKMPINQVLGIGIIIFALYVIIKNTVGFNFIPQVNQNMGYGLLFVVGLLTSLHCIAMCGGINLSQCVSYKQSEGDTKISKLRPSLLYNAGRVVSYTIIGGIFGALGAAVSFSGTAKGMVAILSGIFMVIMGLNMLNIFPWLRKINPRMPKIFAKKFHDMLGERKKSNNYGPFYVGLLNGLMPCGPLQAMQIYALGTGSFAVGALSMFMFSIGTVPLMFGFGAVSSFLGSKFTHRMLKASAVLVMILGVVMMNRGLALSGINVALAEAPSGNVAKVDGNIQTVTTKVESGSYAPIIVQKGIPVKWTIKAEKGDLNGCNNAINIPEFNIGNKKLVVGDNLIEFTPEQEGDFIYTCWMGMISSNIKVVSDVSNVSERDIQQENTNGQGGIGAGGCCAAGSKATKFAGGRIPTDDIQIAKVVDDIQEVTVKVNDEGYSPAVVVIQKGIKTRIKFDTEKLNSCNNIVVFPEYQGQLSLKDQKETPLITPTQDFTFQCGMDMLHGYVKVVDDINNVNLDEIRKEVKDYTPTAGSGGGCH